MAHPDGKRRVLVAEAVGAYLQTMRVVLLVGFLVSLMSASYAARPVKLVVLGDSLTAGYGIEAQQAFPAKLETALRQRGFDVVVENAGVSGDVSAGGLRRVDWAMEGDVRVVIIELGANDILRGQPVDQMKRNLGQIIERAKARGAEVLLAGMEAPTNSGPEYRREVHEAFPALAREHNVPLIPFFLDGVALQRSHIAPRHA